MCPSVDHFGGTPSLKRACAVESNSAGLLRSERPVPRCDIDGRDCLSLAAGSGSALPSVSSVVVSTLDDNSSTLG